MTPRKGKPDGDAEWLEEMAGECEYESDHAGAKRLRRIARRLESLPSPALSAQDRKDLEAGRLLRKMGEESERRIQGRKGGCGLRLCVGALGWEVERSWEPMKNPTIWYRDAVQALRAALGSGRRKGGRR